MLLHTNKPKGVLLELPVRRSQPKPLKPHTAIMFTSAPTARTSLALAICAKYLLVAFRTSASGMRSRIVRNAVIPFIPRSSAFLHYFGSGVIFSPGGKTTHGCARWANQILSGAGKSRSAKHPPWIATKPGLIFSLKITDTPHVGQNSISRVRPSFVGRLYSVRSP